MESMKLAEAKWEGKTLVELKTLPPQQVWPFLADFFNLQKIVTDLETCYQVEGVPGQPGLIRYCAFQSTDDDQTNGLWGKEKLISMDPIKRCLSYEIIESNMGFGWYVGTMQVIPMNNDEGCIIEWSFVCDPIERMSSKDILFFIQKMAKNIEEAFLSGTSSTV
ncbi:lachrymatory-factor synthase-like [Argentina anserina]|uniref:lachrymatory-factor synthase-like n=1 Tax=Argentina anserina TaxID=57926 RepID=UPI0021761F63|nr:lachrymatory-factor synthase-like [Potentilla anserina]